MDVDCMCNHKKCPPEKNPECEEYVVKFDKINRSSNIINTTESIDTLTNGFSKFNREIKKRTNELKKSINRFKV